MASWFSRNKAPKPIVDESDKLQVPGGLWNKCKSCAALLYQQELERNLMVCPKCGYHFRLSSQGRIDLLCDAQSFVEMDMDLRTNDPLTFRDSQRYKERIKKAQKQTNESDAVRTGQAMIEGLPVIIGVFSFKFMGGSMGVVVGEKLTRAAETALAQQKPFLIVSASGGARMQEGIFSLMQMAKVTAALAKLADARLPYISLLTDPTTGGVAASFAMLGDVNIAEPGALIGFAGPRVIQQTIGKTLPEGFQSSEFLLEHGMLDLVVVRKNLKSEIARVLRLLSRQDLSR